MQPRYAHYPLAQWRNGQYRGCAMGYHTERMAGIGYGMAFGRRRQLMEDPRFS